MILKKNDLPKEYIPSAKDAEWFLDYWKQLDNYSNQESALDKLFLNLCPYNFKIEDILIKCSALNDFYSTNIFKVHNVAKHYLQEDIDRRLNEGDMTLVEDLARITINGKPFYFYSFASKYCSHHRPDIYPIYDNYVHKLLKYFRDRDGFYTFKEAGLKNYQSYVAIIKAFQHFYGLNSFTIKNIDKYLWQLGKEAYNPYK